MAWGAEPRDRELLPRPGRPWPQGRGGRGSKEKGVLIQGSSGNFICRFRAHQQHGNRREGLHRLGARIKD
jgi:hypothetical protein